MGELSNVEILKKYTLQEILDLASSGFFDKKKFDEEQKQREQRMEEEEKEIKRKKMQKFLALKSFVLFSRFNILLSKRKIGSFRKKKIFNYLFNIKGFYFFFVFLVFKNLTKYFFEFSFVKNFRLFLINTLNVSCFFFLPFRSIEYDNIAGGYLLMRYLSTSGFFFKKRDLFFKKMFLFSSKLHFTDVILLGRDFNKVYKSFKKDYSVFNCFVRMSKNNVFFSFFRKADGKVFYNTSVGVGGYKGKKKKTPHAVSKTAYDFARAVVRRFTLKRTLARSFFQINLYIFGLMTSFLMKEASKGLYKGGLRFSAVIDKFPVEHSSGITRKKVRRV